MKGITISNQIDVAGFRQFIVYKIHKFFHDQFSDPFVLKFRRNTNVSNLAMATSISDNSSHANGSLVCAANEYFTDGVLQAYTFAALSDLGLRPDSLLKLK